MADGAEELTAGEVPDRPAASAALSAAPRATSPARSGIMEQTRSRRELRDDPGAAEGGEDVHDRDGRLHRLRPKEAHDRGLVLGECRAVLGR